MTSPDIALALAEHSYCVVPNFVDPVLRAALVADFDYEYAQGRFRPAAVGRAELRLEKDSIRRDVIQWWEPTALRSPQVSTWNQWEALRLAVNETLLLGAWDLEAHYAHYPVGAFYRRHLDRFANNDARVLSLVLYLNEDWAPADGGGLLLHLARPIRISPQGGTLVCFLSDRVPHEVLPTARPRRSIAGWFRRRS